MRRALLYALAEHLGDAFSREAQAAWVEAYDEMAETMRRAAATVS